MTNDWQFSGNATYTSALAISYVGEHPSESPEDSPQPRYTSPVHRRKAIVRRQNSREIFFDLFWRHQVVVVWRFYYFHVRILWLPLLVISAAQAHPNLRSQRVGNSLFDHHAPQLFCLRNGARLEIEVTAGVGGKLKMSNPLEPRRLIFDEWNSEEFWGVWFWLVFVLHSKSELVEVIFLLQLFYLSRDDGWRNNATELPAGVEFQCWFAKFLRIDRFELSLELNRKDQISLCVGGRFDHIFRLSLNLPSVQFCPRIQRGHAMQTTTLLRPFEAGKSPSFTIIRISLSKHKFFSRISHSRR